MQNLATSAQFPGVSLIVCPGGRESKYRWRDAIWLLGQTVIMKCNVVMLLVGDPPTKHVWRFAEELDVQDRVRAADGITAQRVVRGPHLLLDFRESGPAAEWTRQAVNNGVYCVLSDIPEHAAIVQAGRGYLAKPGNVSDFHRKMAILLNRLRSDTAYERAAAQKETPAIPFA